MLEDLFTNTMGSINNLKKEMFWSFFYSGYSFLLIVINKKSVKDMKKNSFNTNKMVYQESW
jgi:hypothetical protein